VPQFLSPEWLDALDRAARRSPGLTGCTGPDALVLEQRIAMPDGSEHAHHVVLSDGDARVVAGRARAPDIVVHTDLAVACDLARGTVNAQHALAAGRLRIGGSLDALVERSDVLRDLDDVFASVRATTIFPPFTETRVASRE
jgi:putative sterol carrier protein